jgi:hypothetical protein
MRFLTAETLSLLSPAPAPNIVPDTESASLRSLVNEMELLWETILDCSNFTILWTIIQLNDLRQL